MRFLAESINHAGKARTKIPHSSLLIPNRQSVGFFERRQFKRQLGVRNEELGIAVFRQSRNLIIGFRFAKTHTFLTPHS